MAKRVQPAPAFHIEVIARGLKFLEENGAFGATSAFERKEARLVFEECHSALNALRQVHPTQTSKPRTTKSAA